MSYSPDNIQYFGERPPRDKYGSDTLWIGPGWYILDCYGCHGPYENEERAKKISELSYLEGDPK